MRFEQLEGVRAGLRINGAARKVVVGAVVGTRQCGDANPGGGRWPVRREDGGQLGGAELRGVDNNFKGLYA